MPRRSRTRKRCRCLGLPPRMAHTLTKAEKRRACSQAHRGFRTCPPGSECRNGWSDRAVAMGCPWVFKHDPRRRGPASGAHHG